MWPSLRRLSLCLSVRTQFVRKCPFAVSAINPVGFVGSQRQNGERHNTDDEERDKNKHARRSIFSRPAFIAALIPTGVTIFFHFWKHTDTTTAVVDEVRLQQGELTVRINAVLDSLKSGSSHRTVAHYYTGLPERLNMPGLPSWVDQLKRNNTQAREAVILLLGPQGSGKSELAKSLVRQRSAGIYVNLRDELGSSQQPHDVQFTVLRALGYQFNSTNCFSMNDT